VLYQGIGVDPIKVIPDKANAQVGENLFDGRRMVTESRVWKHRKKFGQRRQRGRRKPEAKDTFQKYIPRQKKRSPGPIYLTEPTQRVCASKKRESGRKGENVESKEKHKKLGQNRA